MGPKSSAPVEEHNQETDGDSTVDSAHFFNRDYPTQIRYIGRYLALPTQNEASTQLGQSQDFRHHFQNTTRKFSFHQDEEDEQDERDEDFDFISEPRKKMRPGGYKRRQRPPKIKGPHNKHAQIFSKLMRCFRKIKDKFSIKESVFTLKPNKQEGVKKIIHDSALFPALAYIFETGMLIDEVKKGKAQAPQKQENIKEICKLKEQFEVFISQATI